MAAQASITLDEPGAKPEASERDKDAALDACARMTPEALDALTPQ